MEYNRRPKKQVDTVQGEFIVKVQRPLVSNAPQSEWAVLIYNEDRSLEVTWPFADQQTKVLLKEMGHSPKQYWYATLTKGTLVLDRQAPRQEW
jgi:hypothetical protein